MNACASAIKELIESICIRIDKSNLQRCKTSKAPSLKLYYKLFLISYHINYLTHLLSLSTVLTKSKFISKSPTLHSLKNDITQGSS